jgi:hypothetical protein
MNDHESRTLPGEGRPVYETVSAPLTVEGPPPSELPSSLSPREPLGSSSSNGGPSSYRNEVAAALGSTKGGSQHERSQRKA